MWNFPKFYSWRCVNKKKSMCMRVENFYGCYWKLFMDWTNVWSTCLLMKDIKRMNKLLFKNEVLDLSLEIKPVLQSHKRTFKTRKEKVALTPLSGVDKWQYDILHQQAEKNQSYWCPDDPTVKSETLELFDKLCWMKLWSKKWLNSIWCRSVSFKQILIDIISFIFSLTSNVDHLHSINIECQRLQLTHFKNQNGFHSRIDW